MNIDGINNGIVLDHIKAGKSMEIYRFLGLDKLDCCVAVIQNVRSKKYGKKDIIKIDSEIEINLDILGYLDPDITVNIVKNGALVTKKHLELPARLENVISCSNPRCITSSEKDIPQIFILSDRKTRTYRCAYCEAAYEKRELL